MKLKMSKQDFESLAVVISGISALKLSLSQILNIENAMDVIRTALVGYFEEKDKLLTKGERFIDGYNLKLAELYKKYGEGSKDPAIQAFGEDGKKKIEEEVNKPLRELGDNVIEVDFEDNLFNELKATFAKEAFFGPKGYNDNEGGKAAFVRVVKAFGIKPEELKSLVEVQEAGKEASPTKR
jgi:hypothetical protein